MSSSELKVPARPFKAGKPFTQPASSPVEVLERTRVTLAPRGAWMKHGRTGSTKMGATRCLIQALGDCDGKFVNDASKLVLAAAKDLGYGNYSTIPMFNDASTTTKIRVLNALDHAIEKAKGGTA